MKIVTYNLRMENPDDGPHRFTARRDTILARIRAEKPDVMGFQEALPEMKAFLEEMYLHTKNVNAYYFGEIGVEAGNEGNIAQCRRRGFEELEAMPGFLENTVVEGSWGEKWNLHKVLRRFLWHDRIHARAMFRMVRRTFGQAEDVFRFGEGRP